MTKLLSISIFILLLFRLFNLHQADVTVVSEDDNTEIIEKLSSEGISIVRKAKEDVLFNWIVTDSASSLTSVAALLKDEGLVLLKSKETITAATYPQINLVAQRKTQTHFFYLFKKVIGRLQLVGQNTFIYTARGTLQYSVNLN